jgi:hypothetical protein
VVIRPDQPALQNREEALDRVGVNVAAHVFDDGVLYGAVRVVLQRNSYRSPNSAMIAGLLARRRSK